MTREAVEGLRNNTQMLEGVERLVVQYTDAMTRELQVADALVEELRQHFDDKTLVELTATIAGYNMVSRFLIAMGIH
jgi:alkylhydroperoxidase family enzyme